MYILKTQLLKRNCFPSQNDQNFSHALKVIVVIGYKTKLKTKDINEL